MISKLLLIRLKDTKSTLLDDLGIKSLAKGEPIPVSPVAWAPELGLTHWGFVLEMKLRQYQELQKLMEANLTYTLLDLDNKEAKPEEKALAGVGLRINPEAV